MGHLAALTTVVAGMETLVETPEAARSATFLFLKNVSVIPVVLLVQVRLVMLLARQAQSTVAVHG